MPSLICAICLDILETKTTMSTTCGHVFCSECAALQFMTRPSCPVCRSTQTFEQLIRLFPEYGTTPLKASSSSNATSGPDLQMPQLQISQMPQPQPCQNPQPSPPPAPSLARTPSVSSLRIWLDATGTRFPWTHAGIVPACDKDGSPVFLGVAAFKNGMHPCKIKVDPQGRPLPFVSYDGKEYEHRGTTYLLPFDPATLEWVRTGHAQLPQGKRPVKGGYERIDAQRLYHALAVVDGVSVPGKAGEHGHMGGANVPWDGRERLIVPAYDVLCWRD
ncbi:hypothetical protein LXA43DRAFT_1016961 [Ganoderma leucocontextum]|nr:hypothetical protein LXA43DRAFT_1016961 [Ganoderma leucocontextum]